MAAYVAANTTHIGIAVTANPSYYEPFTVARLTASLDHLTKGRLAWNVVTGADTRAARNYSRTDHGDANYRYDRADEFVKVVRGLWDSWEDDAFIRDKKSGHYIDEAKLHELNHQGDVFAVKGPLNAGRPPQGHPVILAAGTSERSHQFGGREADVLFTGVFHIPEAVAYRSKIRRIARENGRDPDKLSILPGFTPIVAPTTEQAVEIYDRLNEQILLDDDVRFGPSGKSGWKFSPHGSRPHFEGAPRGARNLASLSESVGVDVTGWDLDAVISQKQADSFNTAGTNLLKQTTSRTRRAVGTPQPVTVRDLLLSNIVRGHIVVGSTTEIADYIEQWVDEGACDGFNVQSAYMLEQMRSFMDLVVPELQRRGRFRTEYSGVTLREHLELPRPENTFVKP